MTRWSNIICWGKDGNFKPFFPENQLVFFSASGLSFHFWQFTISVLFTIAAELILMGDGAKPEICLGWGVGWGQRGLGAHMAQGERG